MEMTLHILLILLSSVLLTRVLIPFLMNHSEKLGLVDQPNHRKVHQNATPIIGGVSIMVAVSLLSLLFPFGEFLLENWLWMLAVSLIFITALLDDKFELSAKFRLFIQVFAAILTCTSGIKIESMYGMFGVYELPLIAQYLLTVVVIVGVTNAFNLLDGIDGLAGSFTLINFLILGMIAFTFGEQELMMFCLALSGASFTFLRFNFFPARIFMGDAGSMSLGFLMVTVSVFLLQADAQLVDYDPFIAIVAVLLIPVTDALRVFLGRFSKRLSMFNPDKTHLHHLLLAKGLNHAKASLIIISMHLSIIIGGGLLTLIFNPTTCILSMIFIQMVISKVFSMDNLLNKWSAAIKQQEILHKA